MDELTFSAFDNRCIGLLDISTTKCRGRHSLRNALNHLKKGWALRSIDREMAVFRGLTAEEEAVSAVYYVLKYRHYKNADLLNPWSHAHKNAAIPFLQILSYFFSGFSEIGKLSPKLHINEQENGEERLRLALSVKVAKREMLAYPEPPLNFGVSSKGKKPNFRSQIDKFLTERNFSDMLEYVKEQANMRNRVLYASGDGYPVLEEIDASFFNVRQIRIMALLKAFLLIEPWPELQPFVQQSLDAFLVMLRKVEDAV